MSEEGIPSQALRNHLRCPACWGDLEWEVPKGATCRACGTHLPSRDRVFFAMVPDVSFLPIIQDTVTLFQDFTANRDALPREKSAEVQDALIDYARSHEAQRDVTFMELWRDLKVASTDRILEVGAGDLRLANKLFPSHPNFVTVEPVPEYLRVPEDGVSVRICCSATRLPFEDGTFDFAFVHAALHHLNDINPVVSEIARVIKPGGRFLAALEPFSAHGSNRLSIKMWENDAAFNIGQNELLPWFSEYMKAFRAAGLVMESVYIHESRIPNKLKWIAPLLQQNGRRSFGMLTTLRCLLTHGCLSIVARRGRVPLPKPQPVAPENFPFSIDEYTGYRNREVLIDVWRRMLAPTQVPQKITASVEGVEHLRRGFSPLLMSGPWEGGKYLERVGAFFLRTPEGSSKLIMSIQTIRDCPIEVEVHQDNISLGLHAISPSDKKQTVEWTLGPAMENRVSDFRVFATPTIVFPEKETLVIWEITAL